MYMRKEFYELLKQMGKEERADMLKLKSIMETRIDPEKLFFYLVQVKLCAFYGYDENGEPYWWFKKYPDHGGDD